MGPNWWILLLTYEPHLPYKNPSIPIFPHFNPFPLESSFRVFHSILLYFPRNAHPQHNTTQGTANNKQKEKRQKKFRFRLQPHHNNTYVSDEYVNAIPYEPLFQPLSEGHGEEEVSFAFSSLFSLACYLHLFISLHLRHLKTPIPTQTSPLGSSPDLSLRRHAQDRLPLPRSQQSPSRFPLAELLRSNNTLILLFLLNLMSFGFFMF